jgi:3-oxoacyl-[acyl-carrier-protein] synthase III
MVATGACEHALVIGGDVMSSIIGSRSRDLRAVRRRCRCGGALTRLEGEPSIVDYCNLTDGTGGPSLMMPAGGGQPAS